MTVADKIDKKILSYLSEKDWASEAAVINETFKGFDISKEEYVNRLERLSQKDLLQYNRLFGSGAFIRITQKGRDRLKPVYQKILQYLATNWVVLATLLVTIATLLFTVWAFREDKNEEQVPFFKYIYDPNEQLFKIEGSDNIDPVKVDWYFAGKWPFEEDKYSLRKINNLDKELSLLDIRDAYGKVLVNTLQQWGKDVIECEFFTYTQNVIPAMIVVTYDTKNATASSTDLVIITRIDTRRPNAQVVARGVSDPEVLNEFFNQNLYQIKHATEYIQENYEYSNPDYSGNMKLNGKCNTVLFDQPVEGY